MIRAEFFLIEGRTRENITIADSANGQETHIRDAGLPVAEPHFEKLTRKLQLLSQPDTIVVFSGSLPPGITPADFAGLVDVCIDSGARVAVDTHGPALAAMAGKKLYLVKPNADELAELTGKDLADLPAQLQACKDLTGDVQVVQNQNADNDPGVIFGLRAVFDF